MLKYNLGGLILDVNYEIKINFHNFVYFSSSSSSRMSASKFTNFQHNKRISVISFVDLSNVVKKMFDNNFSLLKLIEEQRSMIRFHKR